MAAYIIDIEAHTVLSVQLKIVHFLQEKVLGTYIHGVPLNGS